MDLFMEVISACQRGLLAVAATPLGLPGSLFFAGLAGSLLHCAGMCGPFVLGQVMIDAESAGSSGYSEWRRLSGAALIPYHLGRITTYTALGAAAGIATAAFATASMFAWLSSALLALAAALMISQAFGMALGATSPLSSPLARLAAPLSSSRKPVARYTLGVVLGCARAAVALEAGGGEDQHQCGIGQKERCRYPSRHVLEMTPNDQASPTDGNQRRDRTQSEGRHGEGAIPEGGCAACRGKGTIKQATWKEAKHHSQCVAGHGLAR